MEQRDLPLTVKELIIRACRKQYRLGCGGNAYVYRLDDILPALAPYVLRVDFRHTRDLNQLAESTCLSTGMLVGGTLIGQPLMGYTEDGENKPVISFHLRQPGQQLYDWQAELEKECAANSEPLWAAQIHMLETLVAAGQKHHRNPFLPLVQLGYQLCQEGLGPQMDGSNILFDFRSETLGLVDQLVETPNDPDDALPHKDSFKEMVVDYLHFTFCELSYDQEQERAKHPNPVLDRKYEELCRVVGQWIDEAAAYTLAHPEEKLLTFQNVTDNQVIKLDDPPQKLLERLDILRRQAGILR